MKDGRSGVFGVMNFDSISSECRKRTGARMIWGLQTTSSTVFTLLSKFV